MERYASFGAALLTVVLLFVALEQPFWQFKLYAPQYPRGLTLMIGLTGLDGDVREIDMLNHYIGMAHLDSAATFERQHARAALALLCGALLVLACMRKRWLRRANVVLAAMLPLGFLVDSAYWLYRFGHQLDRHAALHIPTFTPQLFGNGTIGQFMTFAQPELGFWLACSGVLILFSAELATSTIRRARRARKTA